MNKLFKNWEEDSFLSKNGTVLRYDKLEHVLLAFLGMMLCHFIFKLEGLQQFTLLWIIWNVIGLAWEFYQLIVKKQLIQPKDLAANTIGLLLSFFLFV